MKKYNIIYADPAWSYEKSGAKSGRGLAKKHYNTMGIEDIKSLRIEEMAENNCVLFMWATFPKIQEALEVIKAWGFTYHNVAFVWVKKTKHNKDFFGMGYWTRANPEVCLLATKGKPKPLVHNIAQLQYAPIDIHSKKPAKIRDLITDLCGNLPRIELFARERIEGWDCWGNEVPKEQQNTLKVRKAKED